MRPADVAALAVESLRLHRLRTAMSGVAVAIGITAVLALTGLGDAAKRYVVDRFSAMGANLATISPGKTETSGSLMAGGWGGRDVTLDDAEAVRVQVPELRAVVPISLGSAAFRYQDRRRDVYVVGVTADYTGLQNLHVMRGRFLPPGDMYAGGSVVVVGPKLAREVFGGEDPVGRMVRIAQRRFRVIGVLEPKGRALGFDYDELALVPVATGLRMFDQTNLHHLMVQASDPGAMPGAIARVKAVLIRRHRAEDFTVVTQDALLRSFRAILDALTAGLAAIAAISVAVAGIGIMNVMLVSVSERIAEVGLLKAIGAEPRQIASLFLTEALLLSGLGGLAGVAVGAAALLVGARIWPNVPLAPSGRWMLASLALALVAGGAFGLAPARRAARLPAAEALRGKR
ncbi:MAG TPA: ABC transporter permease [Candidatus Eisenbacteria bacterium]|nr:ABC transporter permease [Candidatus Eisenbacteria bacterium]